MAKKKPWHTSAETKVYHTDTDCNTGNNIERENIRRGKGNHRECKECKRLK